MQTTLQIQAQDLIEILKSQRNDAEDQYAACLAMQQQLMRMDVTKTEAIKSLQENLEKALMLNTDLNTRLAKYEPAVDPEVPAADPPTE